MLTLDAWIMALLLALMLGVAFVPSLRARANQNRVISALGRASRTGVQKGYWLLFILALGIGVFVRVWRFPQLPRGLYPDGAMGAVEAMSLLRTGTDQYGTSWPLHFEAWQFGQMSVLLAYLTIPSMWLLGVTRLAVRLPMLVVSLLALPVFWDLCRRILGRNFALLALFLLAICPWQITQSRYVLDCNLMGHMMLFSVYLLYLGLSKRPFLYLSMAGFGLTMYAYGVALYTVPLFLVLACVSLLRRRRVRWWEVLLCALIYLAVAGGFLMIMAINFFEWETVTLGPVTLPRFYDTVRSEDILFFSAEPFEQLVLNLKAWLGTTFAQLEGDLLHSYFASRTLYPFSIPALVAGTYLVWRRRRRAVLAPPGAPVEEAKVTDGLSVMFLWLLAMLFCGLVTNDSNVQRSNAVFYPLLFCLAYGLFAALRRVKGLAPGIALIYLLGFAVFFQGYFFDTSYQSRVAFLLRSDMYGALQSVESVDCDRYYVSTLNNHEKIPEIYVMLAHEIDGLQHMDEKPIIDGFNPELEHSYSERYVYTDFSDFEIDPMECAAYVVRIEQLNLFDPEDFLIEEFEWFATAYPRYWAEE